AAFLRDRHLQRAASGPSLHTSCAPHSFDPRLKVFPRTSQSRGNRAVRDLEELCNLRRRHLFDLEQHEDRAELDLHLIEDAVEQCACASLIDELVGAWPTFELCPRIGMR